MPERLHQYRFDGQFGPENPLDVTPARFTGLRFPARRQEHEAGQLGRFVREVKEEVIFTSSYDAGRYLLEKVYTPFELFDQEETWVLLLNTKNRITHEAMAYRGTINEVHIRVAEIFRAAIRGNASAIIFSHNHPSGDPNPSPEDIQITRSILDAGKLLGIDLLDHIVVGHNCWVSLHDRDRDLKIWGDL